MSYMGPKTWDLLPKEMKQVTTLIEFKLKTVPTDFSELTFHRKSSLHNVVRLSARVSLSGNTSAVVICVSIKLTFRKS